MCIIYIYINICFPRSVFPTGINKAILLVLRLSFLTPFRRLVFPTLLFLVAFFLMYGLGIMFRWRIDCIEDLESTLSVSAFFFEYKRTTASRKAEAYQWRRSSINKLMLSASRHNHQVSSLDILIFTRNSSLPDARSESQGLVDRMNLESEALSLQSKIQSKNLKNAPHHQYPHRPAQS